MKLIKMAVIIDQKIYSGGGYQQSLNSALATLNIDKNLVDLDFYTLSKSNINVLDSYNIRIKHIRFSSVIKLISLIKLKFRYSIIHNLLNFPCFNLFENFLIKEKVDIVYFLSPSYLVFDLLKLNYIYTVWDLCHRDHPEFPEVRIKNEFEIREFLYQKILSKAVAIIADSHQGKENIIRRYNIDPSRIEVIPFKPSIGIIDNKKINEDKVIEKFNLKKKYIFYPAQYWPHKNHTYILDALNTIKNCHYLEIHAIFTGFDKGNLPYLIKYAEKLGLKELVQFNGFVTNLELQILYKKSLALVMPSYFGPTNIPPLEAFYLGVPVIYPLDIYPNEQLGNAALFIDLNDPNTLVENIISLIKDKKLSKSLIDKGYERINELSHHDDRIIFENILKKFIRKRICYK